MYVHRCLCVQCLCVYGCVHANVPICVHYVEDEGHSWCHWPGPYQGGYPNWAVSPRDLLVFASLAFSYVASGLKLRSSKHPTDRTISPAPVFFLTVVSRVTFRKHELFLTFRFGIPLLFEPVITRASRISQSFRSALRSANQGLRFLLCYRCLVFKTILSFLFLGFVSYLCSCLCMYAQACECLIGRRICHYRRL